MCGLFFLLFFLVFFFQKLKLEDFPLIFHLHIRRNVLTYLYTCGKHPVIFSQNCFAYINQVPQQHLLFGLQEIHQKLRLLLSRFKSNYFSDGNFSHPEVQQIAAI